VIPLKDENPTQRRPVATLAILVACIGIYFFWQPTPFSDTGEDTEFTLRRAAIPCEVVQGHPLTIDQLTGTFGQFGQQEACDVGSDDSPEGFPDKSVWLSILSSMFLHADLVHLGGNLLFLWIFGNNIEDRLGILRYVAFYLLGGLVATLAHVFLSPDSTIPMIGASGAIAAVMGAYLVWFPDAPVRTLLAFFLILVVRIRAKWVLGFWFVLQFLTSPNSGVAWAAHVGGFVFGVLVALLVRASERAKRMLFTSGHRADAWDPTGGAGYGYYDRTND
jgi:membrane associated rhomboid family serine protease